MKKLEEEHKKKDKNTHIKNIGEKYFETIRKKTSLWQEYTYDGKQEAIKTEIKSTMKALDIPIKIQIPLKENIRYKNIENFEDHNLSNNLALEMIIRNKEFQEYMYNIAIIDFEFENKNPELKNNHYKKLQRELIEKFGFDIKDALSLKGHHPYINEQIIDYLDDVANENLILNPPYIRDLNNGLRRVIDFYFNKKKLYILTLPTNYEIITSENAKNANEKRLFAKIINPDTNEADYILLSVYEKYKQYFERIDEFIYLLPDIKLEVIESELSDDFIKNNLKYLGIPVVTFGTEKIVLLSEDPFPIEFLDKEFIFSLSEDETLDSHFKDSLTKSILPKLKLINSKRITTAINSDLSSNETKAIILNLQNNSNIKSFSEILNLEIEEVLKVKNLKHISKNKELRNRDYANAFFIYDLYNIIGKEFENKILELENEAKIDKNKIKENPQYDTKESKEFEYNKINIKLEKNKSLFSKTYLDKEIQKITNLEISKIRGLHSLMKEYIEECKFKNIILGK